MVSEHIYKGKKIMLRCEVIQEYKGNSHVQVVLSDGREGSFHLNEFLPPNLESYTGWEDSPPVEKNEKQAVEQILAMGVESLNPDMYEDLVGICEVLRVRRKALESDIDQACGEPVTEKQRGHSYDGESKDGYVVCSKCGCRENTALAVKKCPVDVLDDKEAQKKKLKAVLIPVIHKVNEKYEGDKEQTLEWWTGLFADVAVEVISYLGLDFKDLNLK